MITVDTIKLLIPDDLLIALTDDAEAGMINEALIQEIIDAGYEFIQEAAPQAGSGTQDEFVRNYVLSNLYAYAGMDEKARSYRELFQYLLDSIKDQKDIVSQSLTTGKLKVSSNDRQFTSDELEKW